jgi:hypothetical protein
MTSFEIALKVYQFVSATARHPSVIAPALIELVVLADELSAMPKKNGAHKAKDKESRFIDFSFRI